nr:uncharacterized protein LOC111507111 [Leptinotarsa decemlineata]
MSTELSETQKRLIKAIADQNGLTDYQVEAQSGSKKGDNYFGIITSVSLKDKNKNIELIGKSAHSGEEFRKKTPIHAQYVRESHLYESVLSEFKKFQEEYAIPNPFVGFPKRKFFLNIKKKKLMISYEKLASINCKVNHKKYFLFFQDGSNTSKPTKVCLIDWQLAKLGSPAKDMIYFFIVHSPKDILYDYKGYLNFYYEVLCRHLRDFSCDPEDLFPFSTLQKHWNKFLTFGLMISIMILKMMLSDSEEAPDFEKLSDASGDIFDSQNFSIKNESEYHRRVRDIIEFLVDSGLL